MADAYEINVGELFTFAGKPIKSINAINNVDITGRELAFDECNMVVFFEETDPEESLRTVPRGTPIQILKNGEVRSVYYFVKAEALEGDWWQINAISGIGLLDDVESFGGMWLYSDGYTFMDALQDIIGGEVTVGQGMYYLTGGIFDCTVEPAVAAQILTGHLPYADAKIRTSRQNLQDILLAYGASCTKGDDGRILFSFIRNNTNPDVIPIELTYKDGRIIYDTPYTMVRVEEYSFIQNASDQEVVLFDSSQQGAASNSIIPFANPMHSLRATGTLTIVDSNCNYARITGGGILYGKRYTRVSKLVTRGTDDSKVFSLNNVELVNPLNSANVVDRLNSYLTEAKTIQTAFVLNNEKCGRKYGFFDIKKAQRAGFATKMELITSGITKAQTTFVVDYIPQNQGNKYENVAILTGSGTWTVPEGVTDFDAVLIGGGHGSDGSYDGGGGTVGRLDYDYSTGYNIFSGSQGGAGGRGSLAAEAGKVLNVEFRNVGGQSFNYQCGAGGAGGSRNGGAGSAGGATVFGSYTSANGSIAASGVLNLFTGEVYARNGEQNGVDGANGGSFNSGRTGIASGNKGEDVEAFGALYVGAQPYTGYSGRYFFHEAGGGAAWGADATNKNGASAQPFESEIQYGSGGNGQSGGGGGAGGGYSEWTGFNPQAPIVTSAGGGGAGLPGQSGGAGCIIIYY